MKTFVTLFDSHNVHLTKDVGAIPYGMFRFEGYNAYITRYGNNEEFSNINTSVKGLKICDIPKLSGDFCSDALKFIKKNAKKIDVLNLYHFKMETYKLAREYKKYNNKGILYIKCDSDSDNLIRSSYRSIRVMPKIGQRRTIQNADLISVELNEGRYKAIQYFQRDIIHIPNPIIDIYGYRDFKDRENIILFVGRIGALQKNIEMLLMAYCRAHDKISGWKLKLVGPIDNGYQRVIDSILSKYPEAKNDIIFTGNISNRHELKEEYLSSKIVCMPSRWENSSISFLEGIATGNFMIGTDIICFRYMTNNSKYGELVPIDDDNALELAFIKACNDSDRLEHEGRLEYEFAMKNFTLKKICDELEKNIELVKLRTGK